MNFNTVKTFRHEVYQSFKQAKDALFNVLDALASEDRAQSLPELSLSPHFQRKWPSIYEALEDGCIEGEELQKVFVNHLPMRSPFPLIAVDGSSIARAKARTSADRSAQHVHNLPESAKPVTYGWQFSTVVALPEKPSGWTYILSQRRVETSTTAIEMACQQLSELARQLPKETIALLDRGYDSAWLWCQLSRVPIKGSVIRLKNNRCFYRPAPPPTGKRGAPRKRGEKLQPKDPATHAYPRGVFEGQDHAGKPVRVTWWQELTLKDADWLPLTVIQVERPQAANSKRDPRTSWFGSVISKPTSPLWRSRTCIALARNMAIVSTNNRCFGKTCGCGLLSNLSDGVTWLRQLTISWFSHAIWLGQHCARGKTGIASLPCNRCVAG